MRSLKKKKQQQLVHNLGISSFLKSLRNSYFFLWGGGGGVSISKRKLDSSEKIRESAKLHEQSGEFWIVM